jgi:hypothetical protein
MALAQSKDKRTPVPSSRKRELDAIAAAVIANRDKKKAKKSKKITRKKAPPAASESSADDEPNASNAPPGHAKSSPEPEINVDELEYTLSCSTFLDDKKVWTDAASTRLQAFKVHEYNAKSIKAVAKESNKMRTDFEFDSCVATITAPKMKACSKYLEDPDDYAPIEGIIERYMKDGIKKIRVEYVVSYSKKRRTSMLAAGTEKRAVIEEPSTDEDDETPKPTSKKRKI